MSSGFLTNWLFLAVVSMLAPALLIVFSVEAFGGMHSSFIMALRSVGVGVIVAGIAGYLLSTKGVAAFAVQTPTPRSIFLWVGSAA